MRVGLEDFSKWKARLRAFLVTDRFRLAWVVVTLPGKVRPIAAKVAEPAPSWK